MNKIRQGRDRRRQRQEEAIERQERRDASYYRQRRGSIPTLKRPSEELKQEMVELDVAEAHSASLINLKRLALQRP